MKILYVSTSKIPSEAANSVHVMKMAQAFGEQKNDVTLAYASNESMFKANAELYNYYAVKSVFRLFPVKFFLPFLHRVYYVCHVTIEALFGGYDLVYSRCVPSAFCSVLAGRSVVFEIHDSPLSLNPVSRWMFNGMIRFKNLKAIVVISLALKEHLAKICDYPPERILVLHDGADPFYADTVADLAMSHLPYHVGYTGHLYQGRGIDIILSIAKACPDIGFHIVGGRPDDIAYWKSLCVSDNIHFYGHMPHNNVAGYIAAFDCLLAPYQKKVSVHGNVGNTASWMSPLKIFEYMASGKPIICSDMPVLREVLEDGRNCILCDPEDVDAWRAAILFLKSEHEKAQSIGMEARADFEKKYTWSARAREIITYLEKAD